MSPPGVVAGSVARIALAYGAGFGWIILLRITVELFREDILDVYHRPVDVPLTDILDSYDFIIIGGGSAGCVVANRLSENPRWNVLLVEAGLEEPVITDVPLIFPALQKTALDWQFKTEHSEEFCLGMKDQQCNWPRGKVLGGSSTINGMLYVRGNRKDYDVWQELGNEGWNYTECLKYFKKSEDMMVDDLAGDPYHGSGGPLTVEMYRYRTPLAGTFLEAAEELGRGVERIMMACSLLMHTAIAVALYSYPIRDTNGETQTGFSYSYGTLRDGLRLSTAKAFIRPAAHRRNLHVSMGTFVEKILIRKGQKEAYGVIINKQGQGAKRVYVDMEVVLSAGSVQSPQLLMVSGVGPWDVLEKAGVPIVHDLPGVGENLQDHIALGGSSYLLGSSNVPGRAISAFVLPRIMNLDSARSFLFDRNGPLYGFPEIEAMGFVHTRYSDPAEDWPDIQLICGSYSDNSDGGIYSKQATGISDEYYNNVFEPTIYQDSFTVVPVLLRPKSKGRITLRSADPYDYPVIQPAYFSDLDDVRILVEGGKIADSLSQMPAFQQLKAARNPRKIPGCEDLQMFTDAYYECQLRHHTLTLYHPVGTCKMGSDNMAVVDERLRVRGIAHLRVIDASVMPTIPSGNTNAPTIMVAERGSDLIKQDWGYPT